MIIKVLTLFPEVLEPYFKSSMIGRAQSKNAVEIEIINIRDFSLDKHNSVDDYPFGGGGGMIMTPQPIINAHQAAEKKCNSDEKIRTIYCTPKGKTLTQQIAKELSEEKHIIILCGHYEGVDQRAIDTVTTDEISIGDYVLTGGELPAAVIVDSVVRLLPDVLDSKRRYEEESFYNGLLEYPQYTRPREYLGQKVPNILLSGDHSKISKWRHFQSLKETWLKRPDLLNAISMTEEEKEFIKKLRKTPNKEIDY
ncbi:tRNA (Guanine37-N(1)-) methyltransferase [Tindallia magadiensis]|uniref:tRNA (guanine-N(1)-)-methyltransferase n=1 Tax=Tindallia magadiensis TaxID=69895 RepID=A0A1I3AKY6_9FIRM|nr:tRNA (guanosine(37)-N1)-methyltransferase TrmD [Tindallia magadiensis]SFH50662.1 tRNA (Guanine37-N(1)-) methyltransferase [Tindallia magadiensis]